MHHFCFSELYQKVLRTNLVTNIFISAHTGQHSSFIPLINGWVLNNDYYELKWFDGDLSPNDIDIYSTSFPTEDDEADDEYDSLCSSDSDSEMDES